MATSGSSNWTQTRKDMKQRILEIAGVIEIGQTYTSAQSKLVASLLDEFVKNLQSKYNVKLWKLEWSTKTFSDPSEVTGTDDNIYTCIRSHTSASDNKPVTGDDWTTYWTLKGSTGGVWATDTAYTSAGDFTDSNDVIGIENAFYRKNNTDYPIDLMGYEEYMSMANKTSFGNPIGLWFDGKISPRFYVYPQVEDTDDIVIHYQAVLRIEDFDASNNEPDFPVDWIGAIVWEVAHLTGVIYEISDKKLKNIEKTAGKYMLTVLTSLQENSGDMRISPNMRNYTNNGRNI